MRAVRGEQCGSGFEEALLVYSDTRKQEQQLFERRGNKLSCGSEKLQVGGATPPAYEDVEGFRAPAYAAEGFRYWCFVCEQNKTIRVSHG